MNPRDVRSVLQNTKWNPAKCIEICLLNKTFRFCVLVEGVGNGSNSLLGCLFESSTCRWPALNEVKKPDFLAILKAYVWYLIPSFDKD